MLDKIMTIVQFLLFLFFGILFLVMSVAAFLPYQVTNDQLWSALITSYIGIVLVIAAIKTLNEAK